MLQHLVVDHGQLVQIAARLFLGAHTHPDTALAAIGAAQHDGIGAVLLGMEGIAIEFLRFCGR